MPQLAMYVEDRTHRLPNGALRRVEQAFTELALRQGYTVSARSDLGAILQEQAFQSSVKVDSILAARGHVLGANAVVAVSIDRASQSYARYPGGASGVTADIGMSVRVIATANARVVLVASYDESAAVGPNGIDGDFLAHVAYTAATALPSRRR